MLFATHRIGLASSSLGTRRLRPLADTDTGPWTLARAGICSGSLPAHRQSLLVALAAVRSNINQSLDVAGHLPAKISFNLRGGLDGLREFRDLIIREIFRALARVNPRKREHFARRHIAHPEQIGQRNLNALFLWNIDPDNSWHATLPLALFVLRIRADNADNPLPADDLTLITDALD